MHPLYHPTTIEHLRAAILESHRRVVCGLHLRRVAEPPTDLSRRQLHTPAQAHPSHLRYCYRLRTISFTELTTISS